MNPSMSGCQSPESTLWAGYRSSVPLRPMLGVAPSGSKPVGAVEKVPFPEVVLRV